MIEEVSGHAYRSIVAVCFFVAFGATSYTEVLMSFIVSINSRH